MQGFKRLTAAVIAVAAFGAGALVAGEGAALAAFGQATPWQLGFQDSASPVMDSITAFHDFLLYVITAIAAFVLVLLVIVMVVLTFISQYWVSGMMDALRGQMGSVAATPPTNELRASFDRLHRISVNLEMIVLLTGLLALFFTSRVPRNVP